jgi:hypothetical protein
VKLVLSSRSWEHELELYRLGGSYRCHAPSVQPSGLSVANRATSSISDLAEEVWRAWCFSIVWYDSSFEAHVEISCILLTDTG